MGPFNLESIAQAVCAQRNLTFLAGVGSGAFKQTFHVQDGSGASLALKVFELGFSPERTAREIDALRRCAHENIARLISLEEFSIGTNTYTVVIEEFLAGGTLSERLRTEGPLSVSQAKEMAAPLVDALGHIAALGLVHRDLKPDNILFRNAGVTPVIVDFGLVRDLKASSLTQSWVMRGPGTPFFSSPEQLRNEKSLIDWRSDQFSLGVLLAVSVLGAHPYEHPGDRPERVVERVADRGALSSGFLEGIRRLDLAVLERMTAAWPVRRLRTPQLLADSWQ